jgi:hypothetical protein
MIRREEEAIIMLGNEDKIAGNESQYLTITASEWIMF